MEIALVQNLRPRRVTRARRRQSELVTCSLCLRVRHGSEWRDAEQVIRELRSYELEAPPRLHSAVCDVCAESIFSRRAAPESHLEAA